MLWQQIGFVAMGFLLGSILFSYHIPLWMKHIDIVKESLDHNPGTFNAIHLAGLPVGLLCLAADLAKGFLPVWLSIRCLGFAFPLLPLVLAAPVAGHAFTPWYGFRGGKAIAASFGSLMGLLPFSWAVLILAFWYVLFAAVIGLMPHEWCSVVSFFCFAASCAVLAIVFRDGRLLPGYAMLAAIPIYKNYRDLLAPRDAASLTRRERAVRLGRKEEQEGTDRI